MQNVKLPKSTFQMEEYPGEPSNLRNTAIFEHLIRCKITITAVEKCAILGFNRHSG